LPKFFFQAIENVLKENAAARYIVETKIPSKQFVLLADRKK